MYSIPQQNIVRKTKDVIKVLFLAGKALLLADKYFPCFDLLTLFVTPLYYNNLKIIEDTKVGDHLQLMVTKTACEIIFIPPGILNQFFLIKAIK